MSLQNSDTKKNSEGAEHRGLLLLRVAGVLDQINDCEHRGNRGNPNACLKCVGLCSQLLNEAAALSKAHLDGLLFYRENHG